MDSGVDEQARKCPRSSPEEGPSSPHMGQEIIGTMCLIEKTEFLRAIGAALLWLGFPKAAAVLEAESGLQVYAPTFKRLRTLILEGKWEECLKSLDDVFLDAEETRNLVSSIILEQKHLELMQRAQDKPAAVALEALDSLKVMEPVREVKGSIEMLSFLRALRSKDIPLLPRREKLLVKLQKLLPQGAFPETRLVELVEQALLCQKDSCRFHNSVVHDMSLFSDHKCGRDQLPTHTLQILERGSAVQHLQFSHNGRYIASCDGSVAIIWEVGHGRVTLKHELSGHEGPVSYLSWRPDDQQLLTSAGNATRRWSILSGQCLSSYKKRQLNAVSCAWAQDGRNVFIAYDDDSMSMWSLDGEEKRNWRDRAPRTAQLGVTANNEIVRVYGKKVVSLFEWECETEKFVDESGRVVSFSLSSDSKHLLVGLENRSINLWSVVGRPMLLKEFKDNRRSGYDNRVCFGGVQEAFIGSANQDGRVCIFHKSSGELIDLLAGHTDEVNCLSWNPANPRMLVSGGEDKTIRVWGSELDKEEKSDPGNEAGGEGARGVALR